MSSSIKLFHLTEVVVDIKASVSPEQELNQFADNGQLLLHHCYMESSVMNTKIQTCKEFTLTVEKEMLQKYNSISKGI